MAIYELFSKRQKKLRGEVPDIYTYNVIPQKFRVQAIHIVTDCIGDSKSSYAYEFYQTIHEILCREYGRFSLASDTYYQYRDSSFEQKAIFDFLLNDSDTEEAIDVIEVTFHFINTWFRENQSILDKLLPPAFLTFAFCLFTFDFFCRDIRKPLTK